MRQNQANMLERLEAKVRQLEQKVAELTPPHTKPNPVASVGGRAVPMPLSCSALYATGHSLSGFFLIKGSSNTIDAVYCDFTLAPNGLSMFFRVVSYYFI